MSRKLFFTSVSHEACYRAAIPHDGTRKKSLAKAVEDMFQVYYKCGFCVVKLYCDKQLEPALDTWRFKQEPIVKTNYCNV